MAAPSTFWELAATLTWRELTVRYKRSVMGIAWALVEPVVNVFVYVVVFGMFLNAGTGVSNYPLYTLLGVLPWLFFSSTLEQSALALMEHAPLLRKMAFERSLLVIAIVVSRLSTLLIGVALGFVAAFIFSSSLGDIFWARAPLVIIGIIALTLLTTGLSLVAAALQVILRDVQFLLRFVMRLGFFACPIVYSAQAVPAHLRTFYELNPLVGILWFFHAPTSNGSESSSFAVIYAVLFSICTCLFGYVAFRKLQPQVADLL